MPSDTVTVSRELLERAARILEWLDSRAPLGAEDANGIGECCDGLRTALAAPAVEPVAYPPCDYCGAIPDHHPWHGSGPLNGAISPHIHACNACRHLLPPAIPPGYAIVPVEPVAWRWMYDGKPDGPYAFNSPPPDEDVVARGLAAERPRTVQLLCALDPSANPS